MYQLLSNNILLPQVTLDVRSRTSEKSSNSPFENDGNVISYTSKTIEYCSVQPISSTALKSYENILGPEGMKNSEVYHLYTSDKLVVGIQGSGILSDQVQLDSVTGLSLWFTVLRMLSHPYTGVPRYKYLVILDTTQF